MIYISTYMSLNVIPLLFPAAPPAPSSRQERVHGARLSGSGSALGAWEVRDSAARGDVGPSIPAAALPLHGHRLPGLAALPLYFLHNGVIMNIWCHVHITS